MKNKNPHKKGDGRQWHERGKRQTTVCTYERGKNGNNEKK